MHVGFALALARFVLISPKHPDVDLWASDPAVHERLEELRSGGLQRSARDAEAIPLVDTGRTLPAGAAGKPLPVLISPLVDGRFGVTAVLGVPARDHSDAVLEATAHGVGYFDRCDRRTHSHHPFSSLLVTLAE